MTESSVEAQPDWAHRIWRRLYWWKEDRKTRARFPGLRHVVYFGGDGIGDELLCSAPLHELRQREGKGLCTLTRRPEFFFHSPDVDIVQPMDFDVIPSLRRIGLRVSQTTYIHEQRPPDIDVPPPRHLIAEMCRRCDVHGEVALRPYLWLTPEEKAHAASYAGCIAMQSSRKSASLAIGNKEWIPERFQEVADGLSAHHRLVQIGQPGDPEIRGAVDLRGKLSLRESAAVLFHARAFIGLVGFPMHLARAVDCPAVIVYGGREHPDQSGYTCNENLFTSLSCSPCWRWNSCDFAHACMTAIETPHVLAALERLLARPRGPLALDHATLS